MNIEKLIETVKLYKILYDPDNMQSIMPEKKAAAWREVGKVMNLPPIMCKHKWKHLRDSFINSLLRKRLRPEDNIKCKFEDKMSFLLPFIDEKIINFSEGENDENAQERTETEKQNGPDLETKLSALEAQSNAFLQFILNEKMNKSKQDETDLFYASIAQTVKSLSPINRVIARQKIVSVISDLQLSDMKSIANDSTEKK